MPETQRNLGKEIEQIIGQAVPREVFRDLDAQFSFLAETRVCRDRSEAYDGAVSDIKRFLTEAYGFEGKNPLEFHQLAHSENLAYEIAMDLVEIREIDPSLFGNGAGQVDLELTALVAWGHDSIMASIREDAGVRTRIRGAFDANLVDTEVNKNLAARVVKSPDAQVFVTDQPYSSSERYGVYGGNEAASAAFLVHVLDRFVDDKGNKLFKDVTYEKVMELVAVTYPEFKFEEVKGRGVGLKAWQPYLTKDAGLAQIELAFADLKAPSGSMTVEEYVASSNAEFREINARASELLAEGQGVATFSPEDRVRYFKAGMGWAQTAGTFVAYQKEDFEAFLADSSFLNAGAPKRAEIKAFYEAKYSRFDANIAGCDQRYARLVAEYGFPVRQSEEPAPDFEKRMKAYEQQMLIKFNEGVEGTGGETISGDDYFKGFMIEMGYEKERLIPKTTPERKSE